MPLVPDVDRERLAELCRRFHVAKLELFGSRAKGTARPDSDIDLLVTFTEGKIPSFLSKDGFVALNVALQELLGHSVDVLIRDAVERGRNPYFRASVLSTTEVLYAA
jgi:predicted nucleotidyltransferase